MSAAATLRLHEADNVAVALHDLRNGSVFCESGLVAGEEIPAGHKVALENIPAGAVVRKYGQAIGVATTGIPAGSHVHVHNLAVDDLPARSRTQRLHPEGKKDSASLSFNGFRREHGQAGTRNYVAVLATVNCSATVVRRIVDEVSSAELDALDNVDGIVPLTHLSGCGMPRDGAGLSLLRRTLGGFIRHPNVAGVVVVGLGCEVNDIRGLLESLDLAESDSLRTLAIQDAGGTQAAIATGAAMLRELLQYANSARRQPIPATELTLGLQCGGSDSFSGVTANPALGVAADKLVQAGGTVVLAETPEIFGAEHLLMDRAANPSVVTALQRRLDWWQDYAGKHGASLNNNPSPGNIDGGISTILEKSLGAVMKAGTSPLRAVYEYAEPIQEHGLVFMDSPGYDPCSVTGEIAAGANLICFTTGRGSVFGAKPVPSVKLASNSALASRMQGDIDYDCGHILSGGKSLAEAGDEILELLLATASGRQTRSEANGLGDFEFVPWQQGAVL